MTHETARYADGPAVAQWLNEKGVEPYDEHQRKRIKMWSQGTVADFFAIDRILIRTKYGTWDLPEDVWLEIKRPRDLARAA